MITVEGYSKDPNIIPEGIVITWSVELIKRNGGLIAFLRKFEEDMKTGEDMFINKCRNRPKMDNRILFVYIIVSGRLKYRCFYGGYRSGEPWPHIVMAGPVEKCPFKRELGGFRGFRYSTKLF